MRKFSSFHLLGQSSYFDILIILIPVFLSLFGIVMIYEASNVIAFQNFSDKYHFIKDQLIWFIIGLSSLVTLSFIPYKKYYFLSVPIFIFSLVFLILVLVPGLGITALGAKRWLNLGGVSFQPSEFVKVALILYLASWFSSPEKNRGMAFFLLMFLVIGLVLLQPDLGTGVILTMIFLVMYFLSAAPLWHFFILIPFVLFSILFLSITSPYRLRRVTSFLNPNIDPLGASYHIRQILIALGSGGLWGLGLGASRQKYQYLPEVTTDSIFAIIGEEFGFIGTAFLILLFVVLIIRIYRIISHAPDKHSFLLGSGVLALIASQVLINLGSMVALFPLTGVPLPFISYGGSNLIVSLSSIGIILSISRYGVFKTRRGHEK